MKEPRETPFRDYPRRPLLWTSGNVAAPVMICFSDHAWRLRGNPWVNDEREGCEPFKVVRPFPFPVAVDRLYSAEYVRVMRLDLPWGPTIVQSELVPYALFEEQVALRFDNPELYGIEAESRNERYREAIARAAVPFLMD